MTGSAAAAGAAVAPAGAPNLHLPEEPVGRKVVWRQAVLDGTDLAAVVGGDGGVGAWLWERWQILGGVGLTEADLRSMAVGYRREIGLWLVGDRSWGQCCSGLVGRVYRRIPC